MNLILAYVLVVNIIGFLSMFLDKQFAIKNMWRISERNLIIIAAIGGSAGSFIAMNLFRHKTQKYFKFLIPVILFIQLALIIYFYY